MCSMQGPSSANREVPCQPRVSCMASLLLSLRGEGRRGNPWKSGLFRHFRVTENCLYCITVNRFRDARTVASFVPAQSQV